MLQNLKKSDWSEKGVVEQGFTLIELLVVIAILGILAVVGVLSFNGLTGWCPHRGQPDTRTRRCRPPVTPTWRLHDGTPAADVAGLGAYLRGGANAPKCTYTIDQGPVVPRAGDVTQMTCP